MKDWNPDLYKRFEQQRTQPVKDLINSINLREVNRIIDIGCGPGNSTEQLLNRWKDAETIGIDSSNNMIEQAKKRLPQTQFIQCDAGQDLTELGIFDLVFSNAAIQWMPNHRELLHKFFSMIGHGGALAIQIPDVSNMGIQKAVEETAADKRWKEIFNYESPLNYDNAEFYYDICSELSDEIVLWETYYYHVMEGHESIIDWYKSTGMKPFLDLLNNDSEKENFENEVLERTKKEYKKQSDGKVLFPFKRIFFIVYKV